MNEREDLMMRESPEKSMTRANSEAPALASQTTTDSPECDKEMPIESKHLQRFGSMPEPYIHAS